VHVCHLDRARATSVIYLFHIQRHATNSQGMIRLGPFQARRRTRQEGAAAPQIAAAPLTLLCDREIESRHEPDSFTARAVARDPYTAWVEQREAEQEGQQPIRWIYRQRERELSAAR